MLSIPVCRIGGLFAVALMGLAGVSDVRSADQADRIEQDGSSPFQWIDIQEPAGRFLLPVDWQLSTSKGKLLGSFIVRKVVDGDSRDRRNPQLTVNPISLARMHRGLLSEQIETYIASISADERKAVEFVEPVGFGQYRGYAVRFQSELDGQTQRFHRYYIADDSTSILLVMTFSASVVTWDSAWKTGKVMMNNFQLDSDIRANQ